MMNPEAAAIPSSPPRAALTAAQLRWGIDQWSAYLKTAEIPVLPWTLPVLETTVATQSDDLSARHLADVVYADPYLALKLLRAAEARRSQRLGRETTTPLASVLQTGVDGLLRIVRTAPVVNGELRGLHDCQYRSLLAASVAKGWASLRADVSPDEVAMAALLSECGELLLWHFAPELPQRAHDELLSGRALRTLQAQQQTCGFSFKAMTLALVDSWQLPQLITQFIRGSDTLRANIARLATDVARHIVTSPENPAIPADVIAIREYLPNVGVPQLLAPLPISPEFKEFVKQQVAG